jgi:hypothetical protein
MRAITEPAGVVRYFVSKMSAAAHGNILGTLIELMDGFLGAISAP